MTMPGLTLDVLAATLHHRFVLAPMFADPDGGGRRCPTCEGDCTVPTCTDPGCSCELDPPCAEANCPTCGGIGSV